MLKRQFSVRVLFRGCLIIAVMGSMIWAVPGSLSAQQPTATIVHFAGDVFVTSQEGDAREATAGMILRQGDHLYTHAGAAVVLQLSDGSELEIGEDTNLTLDVLMQNQQTGARKSRLKLWWGRVRSVLSPGHQAADSAFEVRTPNALAGVKFSEPDSEFIFDPQSGETKVIAHQFDIEVTNLLTGITDLIIQGQSGIVLGGVIEKVPYLLQSSFTSPQLPAESVPSVSETPATSSETPSASTESTGSNVRTIATLGASAAIAAGGVVLYLNSEEEEEKNGNSSSFAGKFVQESLVETGVTRTVVFNLAQEGNTVSGDRTETVVAEDCCTATGTGSVTGTVEQDEAYLTAIRGAGQCSCISGSQRTEIFWAEEVGIGPATLGNNGRVLQYDGNEYIRQ